MELSISTQFPVVVVVLFPTVVLCELPEFSLLHVIHTISGAHTASYTISMGGGFLPGGKAASGVKLASHLLLVPKSRKMWIYTTTPP
jgi:hypothetical protein